MNLSKTTGFIISGVAAGAVNGLFGAGGGMVLVPLLSSVADVEDKELFPTSVAIILPVSLVSLGITALRSPLPLVEAIPYLAGSAIGGILTGFLGKRIPTKWLHRALGALVLIGGIRYLC